MKIDASTISKSFGATLERVIGGETVEITRYNRVVAVLAPAPNAVQPDTAQPVVPDLKKSPQSVDDILKNSRRRPGG
jgi:antitoxin (DNA-binding transcriptional repressor) of toxin-antitoxin stability system